MTSEEKWADLVKMAQDENKDGDYDAILWAHEMITRLNKENTDLENEFIAYCHKKPKPIEFYEDDGTLRKIVWNEGDPSVGIFAGYESADEVSFDEMKEAIKLAYDYIKGNHDHFIMVNADYSTVRFPISKQKRENLEIALDKFENLK